MAAQPPSPSPISFGSLFFVFLVSLPLLYCLSRTAAVAVGSCGVAGGGEVVAPPEPQPLPPLSLFFSFPLPFVHTIACGTRRRRSSDGRGWRPEEVVRQRRRGASRRRARAAGVARGTVEGNRGGAPCIFTRCRSAGELTARPCCSASHCRRSFRVRVLSSSIRYRILCFFLFFPTLLSLLVRVRVSGFLIRFEIGLYFLLDTCHFPTSIHTPDPAPMPMLDCISRLGADLEGDTLCIWDKHVEREREI
jgi:hypothetical protein